MTWNYLGPREKQLLVLRRGDEALPSRSALSSLGPQGDDVAYTTVSTILGRLVESGGVAHEEEFHVYSPLFLDAFDAGNRRHAVVGEVVDRFVDEVAHVHGTPRLALLAEGVRTDRDVPEQQRSLNN